MKKGTGVLLVTALLLLIIGLIVPISVAPSDDTRVIIDHTKKAYSTPACFDQADFTNNLEETTLAYAKSIEYKSESNCTSSELVSEKKPFLIAIFQ